MLKKELILEGLDCVDCSAKIEREVNEIEGVEAYMNFMTKTLILEIEEEDQIESILKHVKSIVRKYEPEVFVKEKFVAEATKYIYILEGLG